MTIVWRRRAQIQIGQIHAFVARVSGPAHAYEVLYELHKKIGVLTRFPQMGAVRDQRGRRELIVRVLGVGYRVTYLLRAAQEEIVIVAVEDTRRLR
jgi:plasmid stabilization system protein ParE